MANRSGTWLRWIGNRRLGRSFRHRTTNADGGFAQQAVNDLVAILLFDQLVLAALWIGALDTFILSLFLVFLREATGNLWAGITLHATKNLVAFITLFIIGVK